uniref:Uncharacterized protein n=1 Tax=Onchocerca volvulus TaxID=6282 RepID=A0A8R1Y233_ONCVO
MDIEQFTPTWIARTEAFVHPGRSVFYGYKLDNVEDQLVISELSVEVTDRDWMEGYVLICGKYW